MHFENDFANVKREMQKCQQQHRQHEKSLHVAAAVASLRARERERGRERPERGSKVMVEGGGVGVCAGEIVA